MPKGDHLNHVRGHTHPRFDDARSTQHPPDKPVNAYTYRNYRCGCDGCRAANRALARRYYARRYATTLDDRACVDRRRFSIEPVERWVSLGSSRLLGELLDVTAATVRQWRVRGIAAQRADQIASQLGVHPQALWPNYCDEQGVAA